MLIGELFNIVDELPLINKLEKEQYQIIIRYALFKYLEMKANDNNENIVFFIETELKESEFLKLLGIEVINVTYKEKDKTIEGTVVQVPRSLFKEETKEDVLKRLREKNRI